MNETSKQKRKRTFKKVKAASSNKTSVPTQAKFERVTVPKKVELFKKMTEPLRDDFYAQYGR